MPSLLILAFFPAFSPPSSGGEMRLGGIYRALSETHDITLLTSTDFGARYEEIAHTPRFRELRFPKDAFWRAAYATLERRGLSGELSGLAFALAVSDPDCELSRTARELAGRSDLVIHEFPYSEPIFSDGCPVPEIYNSHNFEADLLGSIVQGPGLDAALLKLMRLEGNLVKRAQRVFATSSVDAEKFRLFYGVDSTRLSLCPNGYDDSELSRLVAARKTRIERPAKRPALLFTGSAHRPNVEAAEWLLGMAPKLPGCDFILAGGLCNALAERKLPDNVTRFGPFDASQKSALLENADLYLNPVLLGSGTSLKAIEALGANLPMVTTPEGARGLGLVDGVHASIVDRVQFVASVEKLLSDVETRKRLATAGREFVEAGFSWRHIAVKLAQQLERPRVEETLAPPLALAFNDYPVLEGNSGGIARIRNLHANLQCDMILLTFGADFQISPISPGVLNVTVPKTAPHQAFEAAVNDNQPVSINDGVAALFAGGNRLLLEIAAAVALRAHALIFEHPYMAPVLDGLKAIRPDLPMIYSAHNVEARHKGELLNSHPIGATFNSCITELENRLVKDARLVICCTQKDKDYFESSGVPVVLTPNGCSQPGADLVPEAKDYASAATRPSKAGFLGSSHPPNIEAALYIVQHLAPLLPDVRFEFVGSVCDPLAKHRRANVILHGVIDDALKSKILAGWDVALNPLQSGGGSSLKLPDYMIHGLATLNTQAGARGFPVVEFRVGRVVEQADFAGNLREMLADPGKLAEMGANARSYAQNHLCWPAVTVAYRTKLRALFSAPGKESSARRKLLVVTYRYTEPSFGGAEEYLVEILKTLRIHFERIDLAAVNVEQITNKYHFGCQITPASGRGAQRLGELFDQTRFFNPEQPDEDELITTCRDLERVWGNEELALLSPFAKSLSNTGRPRLFSGFFHPESHGGVTKSWTTPDFSFLIPDNACIFQIAGFAAIAKSLELTLLQIQANGEMQTVARFAQQIPVNFDVSFSLPLLRSDAPLILKCKVEEHQGVGDHRPLGVLLEKAAVLRKGQSETIGGEAIVALHAEHADLAERLTELLRVTQCEKLVESFRDTAQRREPKVDTMFASARGPHSPQMQEWLATHAAAYDVVLVQGIPFDVIPSSVATLANLPNRPRIVTLPHFHGDDRFYHWRDYYRSFGSADRTLLFSSFISQRLGDPRQFAIVPGGGVRFDEYGDAASTQAFAKIHPDARPFFLVLGRKTASKGYQLAMLAHQILRQSRDDVDLVLIGPDDDGHRIDAKGVFYFGQQSREVIRGALASCLGLVTMSQSESFGIVLCEAWLFGKPVIANKNCTSFRELVRHCETGFLVGAVPELAAAMNVLANDENLRDQMGQAGFAEVAGKYGWEQVAEAVLAEL